MCLPLSVITTSPFIGPLHLSGVSVFVYNFQFSLLWGACHLRLPLCCGQEPHTNRAATRRGARTRDLKLGTCACDGAPCLGPSPLIVTHLWATRVATKKRPSVRREDANTLALLLTQNCLCYKEKYLQLTDLNTQLISVQILK